MILETKLMLTASAWKTNIFESEASSRTLKTFLETLNVVRRLVLTKMPKFEMA